MRCLVRGLLIVLLLVVVGVAAGVVLWGDGPRITFEGAELRELISAELGTDAPLTMQSASIGLGGAELGDVDLELAPGIDLHVERVDLEGVDWTGLADRTRLAADLLVLQGVTLRIDLDQRPAPADFVDGLSVLSADWASGELARMEAAGVVVLLLEGGDEIGRLGDGAFTIDALSWAELDEAALTALELEFTSGAPCNRLRLTWDGAARRLGAEAHATAIPASLVRALTPRDFGVGLRTGTLHELDLRLSSDDTRSEAQADVSYEDLRLDVQPAAARDWALPLDRRLVPRRGRPGDLHRARAIGAGGADAALTVLRDALVRAVTHGN